MFKAVKNRCPRPLNIDVLFCYFYLFMFICICHFIVIFLCYVIVNVHVHFYVCLCYAYFQFKLFSLTVKFLFFISVIYSIIICLFVCSVIITFALIVFTVHLLQNHKPANIYLGVFMMAHF